MIENIKEGKYYKSNNGDIWQIVPMEKVKELFVAAACNNLKMKHFGISSDNKFWNGWLDCGESHYGNVQFELVSECDKDGKEMPNFEIGSLWESRAGKCFKIIENEAAGIHPIVAICTKDGFLVKLNASGKETGFDLIKPWKDTKTIWINLYPKGSKEVFGVIHDSPQDAEIAVGPDCIDTIELKIPR